MIHVSGKQYLRAYLDIAETLRRSFKLSGHAAELTCTIDDTHAMILTRFDGNLKVDPATEATNTTYDLVSNLKLEHAQIHTTGAPKHHPIGLAQSICRVDPDRNRFIHQICRAGRR